ncbi:MAG: rhamnogalacturonan acetylesterase [Sphingobacteriaceae bacterium]|jgi:lysophospholipase L1-like esterase|nr:rhamnogalacturonan acetylesterase [Sphingobacteriaceae bacterium]
MTNYSKLAVVACALLCLSFIAPPQKLKVYLIGDSTMSVKQVKYYPETGWGMPFATFFDQSVVIDNRAQNGRSTKSFMAENRWTPVVDSLKAGDYVFIQFGHNDEVKTKATYTTEAEFRTNLTKYVSDTRSKKAIPILITPVARRTFDSSGKLLPSHEAYSAIVQSVAAENKVVLIDLDKLSQELLQKWGAEKSILLYNHLAPGEHPNYPAGKQDNTHFNELGARLMAQLVLAEIKKLNLPLADRIVKPQR